MVVPNRLKLVTGGGTMPFSFHWGRIRWAEAFSPSRWRAVGERERKIETCRGRRKEKG